MSRLRTLYNSFVKATTATRITFTGSNHAKLLSLRLLGHQDTLHPAKISSIIVAQFSSVFPERWFCFIRPIHIREGNVVLAHQTLG